MKNRLYVISTHVSFTASLLCGGGGFDRFQEPAHVIIQVMRMCSKACKQLV